jgi:cobalt-zinc-cadmium efflux system protein
MHADHSHEGQHPAHDGHGHSHSAASANEGRLRFVLLLSASYLAVEVVASLMTNSLALLADAGHMLADVAGVTFALIAIRFARRPASLSKTYGYYRLEMLAALLNGLLLLVIAAYILIEAYLRFSDPPEFDGVPTLAVASIGLVVNVVAAFSLHDAQKESLNMRGAYLEVMSDLLGSVAVIIAAAVFLATGFQLIDVLASVFIGLFILPRTWSLIDQAVHVLLEGAPRNVDLGTVRQHILEVPGVTSVHDLHVWNLTSGLNVMSAHVVIDEKASSSTVLDQLNICLGEHFDIEHSTFQIESRDRSATERLQHR